MSANTLCSANTSTSISPDVTQAIIILQQYCSASINIVKIEQYEHALDELIRHPQRVGNPRKIAYSALQNARKFTYDRLKIAPTVPYQEDMDSRIDSSAEEHQLVCDIGSFIDHSVMDQRDQKILHTLLTGYETEDIAKAVGVPAARAQVWVSRARKKAAKVWLAA